MNGYEKVSGNGRMSDDRRSGKDVCRGPRRCRVALLPDCHVQFGRESLPVRPTRRLYGAARWLLETYLDRLVSMDVDAVFLLGDTLDPADDEGLRWLKSLINRLSQLAYGAAYAERHGTDEDRDFWWSWR